MTASDRPGEPTTDPTIPGPVSLTSTTDPTTDHDAAGRGTRALTPTNSTTTDRGLADESDIALKYGLNIALWSVSIVASWMAAVGQVGTSEWAGIEGPLRFGLPVITEAFAVTLLLLGYWQGKAQRSPLGLWTLAWAVGAYSGYLNFTHAGEREGTVYAMATFACVLAWTLKYRIKLTNYLTSIEAMAAPRPKLGKLFIAAPRVAIRAWLIAVRRGVTTTSRARDLAERWIRIYQDLRAAKQSRTIAKRGAWDDIYSLTGGVPDPMPTTINVDRVRAVETTPTATTGLPTAAGAPTDRPADLTADRPTDRPNPVPTNRSTDRPTVGRLGAVDRPDRQPTDRPARTGTQPTAVDNAAILRSAFPDGLPTDVKGKVIGRRVRDVTKWSHGRAEAAIEAYLAGADLPVASRTEAPS